MPRLSHGDIVTHEQVEEARRELAAGGQPDQPLAAPSVAPENLQDFDFMFGDLQKDPANLLLEAPRTNERLKRLGREMGDPGDPADSRVPAIYTYFGQFIDHDITLEETSLTLEELVARDMVPLTLDRIRQDLKNTRVATLELDSLYGPANHPVPHARPDRNKLLIGHVTRLKGLRQLPELRVRLKGDDNDLPRRGRNADPKLDREARIGDPRNDENLIVSQLHVAFIKAHNALVDKGNDFATARRLLRQHYQHLVIHDFLKRVADPAIVDGVLQIL
jgi:hypothetical protein